MNGPSFKWYVQKVLCPTLHKGQVVVMDNLSSHHQEDIRALIEARGCHLLYLSPYSPDFNPIELLFSKVKALVRAGSWRTLDDLLAAIWAALEAVTPQDVAAWFRHVHPSASL